MSSRIWPPPTAEEEARAAVEINNPFQEECGDCGENPCSCNFCGDCGNANCDCTCDDCDMCGCTDCECYDVYVIYHTRVVVRVDSDGDITGVSVDSSLDEAADVEDEDGDSLPADNAVSGERALRVVGTQEWPSWDIA